MLKLQDIFPRSALAFLALGMAGSATAGLFGTSYQSTPIVDPQLFGRPVTAVTMDIPSGWRTQGGVNWNPQSPCLGNAIQYQFAAHSPDGAQAIEVMPGYDWQVRGAEVSTHPCPTAAIGSVRQYLAAVAQHRRSGAQILGYRDRPDIVAEQTPLTQSQGGMARRAWYEAGELMIGYKMNGRDMRETLSALASFSEMNVGRSFIVGNVMAVLAVRAPEGKLDAGETERIRKSMRVNKEWATAATAHVRRVSDAFASNKRTQIENWHQREMAAINAKGMADRAAIRANTAQEVARINAQGYANRQASQDAIHRNNIDTIREVNRYHDPSTNRQVELSSHNNYGFRTGNGNYVSTDNPNFNPGVGGQQLQRVK